MAYGTKVIVNAGGLTQKQVDLILKLANERAWDLHNSQKMREWFAMHIGDLESNPAASPLTGGWKGTGSAFIGELQKLPKREDVQLSAAVKVSNKAAEISEIQKLLESDPWGDEPATAGEAAIRAKSDEIHETNKPLVGPGVYNYEGIMYAVKESKQNPGRHYAYQIRLVGNKFKHEYAKGVIFKLTEEMRVSAEAVVALNISTIHEHNGKRVGSCCVCGRMLTKKSSIDAGIGPICGGRVGL